MAWPLDGRALERPNRDIIAQNHRLSATEKFADRLRPSGITKSLARHARRVDTRASQDGGVGPDRRGEFAPGGSHLPIDRDDSLCGALTVEVDLNPHCGLRPCGGVYNGRSSRSGRSNRSNRSNRSSRNSRSSRLRGRCALRFDALSVTAEDASDLNRDVLARGDVYRRKTVAERLALELGAGDVGEALAADVLQLNGKVLAILDGYRNTFSGLCGRGG